MNPVSLFKPKSIAIVGASQEDGKIGNVLAKNILNLGYSGEVFLVNPKYDRLFEKKCYHSLFEIEKKVELAILAIPAELILAEIKKNSKKIKNYVIISAGFSEIGGVGQERERALLALVQEEKLNILGPNCLGFIVPKLKLNASFAGGLPESGNIAFVSQSGALAVALMDMAKKKKLKFSNIISIGNKMSLDESVLLDFLGSDEDTEAIGMYLESIKNGARFMESASRVSKKKPIIVLKAGKNSKTQKAIASHTGALAGDDEIISAVFEKSGVLRADNLEDFFNLFNLIKSSPSPREKQTVVLTNAGGVGVLAADSFSGKTLELWEIPEKIKNELRAFLPREASVENPVDLLGDAKEDRYAKTLEIIGTQKEVGSIICILTPQDQTPVEKISETIIDFRKKTKKTIVAVFLGGERVEKAIEKLELSGVCNFNFPDGAVRALDGYFRWSRFKDLKVRSEERAVNLKRKKRVLEIIKKARSAGRGALHFSESACVLEMYGVKTIKSLTFSSEDELDIQKKIDTLSFPVVLKVDSDQVLHKTDKQGLILDIKNFSQLKEAVLKMKKNFPGARLLVQPMAARGVELIAGIKRDAIFGPVIVYGLGGIYTEIFKKVDYLVSPLNLAQIEESLKKGKLSFLFAGARGQKEYNLEELAQNLQGLMQLALEAPEILEFDINPLVIYNNGQEALALDVKIII